MAKSSKTTERRARIEQLERERKSAERRRLLLFSGVIGLVALVIIGATGWSLWSSYQSDQQFADTELAAIGVGADAAACDPVQEEPVTGFDHIDPPQPIDYQAAPPAAGPHRPTWEVLAREFYSTQDRPEVANLVHNLEHGYNILWYDQTIADDPDKLAQVEGLAAKFSGDDRDPANAFIAAPWTADDGAAFPQGKHLALTHWYADPEDATGSRDEELGITQYCGQLSGGVVADFMQEYPQNAAPEGSVANL